MAQSNATGSTFRCEYHQVNVSTFDPSWDVHLSDGFCPLCPRLQLRPRLVAKPFEVEKEMHNVGYCSCCGSFFEPPTAPALKPGVVVANHYTSIAPGLHTIQPDGTLGEFAPEWYAVGGAHFGQFGDPENLA